MNEDRSVKVTIGGQEYKLLLTMGATRQICAKYGDITGFGKKLVETKDFSEQAGDILWMLALLINQTVLIHNMQHPGDKRELITEEYIELFSYQFEIREFTSAVREALSRGSARIVPVGEPPESKDGEPKNGVDG
jgi:hypothetical protein